MASGRLYRNLGGIFLSGLLAASCFPGSKDPAADVILGRPAALQEAPEEAVSSAWFTYDEENGGTVITGLSLEWFNTPGAEKNNLILPETLGGRPVTALASEAFRYTHSLKSVYLPPGLTTIGWGAFANCSGLEKIVIDGPLEYLPSSCFFECTALKEIRLPPGLKELRTSAFNNCFSLGTLELPESLWTIGDRVFSNCQSLVFISLPAGLQSLGNYAFYGCRRLREVRVASNRPAA
ncbi:MAG: leucine-rich repeat domain-containing protein, partial [Spirochaetales bacterium]|nr:leucine-rich repeat domain-containing protein [Spirochaetales bacterium]